MVCLVFKMKKVKELIYKSEILGNVPVILVVSSYRNNSCLYVGLKKEPDESGV